MNLSRFKIANKLILYLIFSLITSSYGFSQTLSSETLFRIGNENITAGEFMRIYKKNSKTGQETLPTSVDDYLKLYSIFKLKVHEAILNGNDTVSAFLKELNGYRDQLAKPYLTDQQTIDGLTKEAYERMQSDVDASHILIRVARDADPADTLKAYQKIIKIRERLLAGEDFEKIARATSDDPSVRNNGGHLGYFTVFQMVYPFETAAYHTQPGEITMPVRTRFGYHLIKVNGIRKDPGTIKVAHIMIAVPRNSSNEKEKKAKEKVDLIYNQLKEGSDFAALATKYSDDYNSAKNGGDLPWFGTGRMIPEFANAAFKLQKNGEISVPIKTSYGWHIIKRIDQKRNGSFNEEKAGLEKKIFSSEREKEAKSSFFQKLRSKYKFWMDSTKLVPLTENLTPGKFSEGLWKKDPAILSDQPLFGFAGHQYTLSETARAIEAYFKSHQKKPVNEFMIHDAVNQFVNQELMAYAKSRLENTYPDFAYLMKEYHDGMLLFDISDKMVWSKAVEDTLGLQEFYKKHSNNYLGSKRLAVIDFSLFNPNKRKDVEKAINKGNRTVRKITYYKKKFPADTSKGVLVERIILESGDFPRSDSISWKERATYHFKENGITHIWLAKKILKPIVKPLSEIKGKVTSDYQNYLEKKWVNQLYEKYPVSINQEVLKKVKQKLSEN